jgi:hypothetical protein
MMVAGDEESDGDGDEGGGRATATMVKVTGMRVMVTVIGVVCNKEARVRVMPKAMRVVRNEEGEGSKATATVTRVAGEQWQWQQGWWARKRARLARMAMATKRRQRDDDEMTTRRDDDKTLTRRRDDDKMTTRRCSGYHGRLIFLANGAQRVTLAGKMSAFQMSSAVGFDDMVSCLPDTSARHGRRVGDIV